MTIISQMPKILKCPSCSSEIPSTIRYCWDCGYPIHKFHETCAICGGPINPPRRHRGPLGLAYYCGCGFACTKKSELEQHLKDVK